MRKWIAAIALAVFGVGVQTSHADTLKVRIMGGSVQLGGEITIRVRGADGPLPDGSECRLEVPPPYDTHFSVSENACERLIVLQGNVPLLDDLGMALPSAEFSYEIIAKDSTGAEIGRADGVALYNNQFSDLHLLIKGIRNPVKPGATFEAVVLGARRPIDPSLLCRWNTYGPVKFTPTSENACEGEITALPPDGRDGDMDVEIVNLTDMHAVGYATAQILVED